MKQNSFQSELQALRQSKLFLTIFVLLFICVIIWTTVTVFSSQTKSVVSAELKQYATPLTPVLDEATLDLLQNERTFSESELSSFTIYRLLKTERGNSEVIVPLGEDLPSEASLIAPQTRPDPSASPSAVTPTPLPTATPTPEQLPSATPDPLQQPAESGT